MAIPVTYFGAIPKGYIALAPLIASSKAPADSLEVLHPYVFTSPTFAGFINDTDQVFIFKDARTGVSEIPVTQSGFNHLKELKNDTTDNVMKVFISIMPAAEKGTFGWLDGAGKKHEISVDVQAGVTNPLGGQRVKVTRTDIEDWR